MMKRVRPDGTRAAAGGFTIMELMLVISMIMLLMAMLLPAFSKSREAGQELVCSAHVRNLATAWTSYPNDHNDWMVHGQPRGINDTINDSVLGVIPVGKQAFVLTGDGPGPIEQGALYPYTLQDAGVFQCPSELRGTQNWDLSNRSYAIIGPLYGEGWSSTNRDFVGLVSQLPSPSKQAVWVEENDYRGNWNVGSWLMGGNYHWVDYVANYHDGADNVGFADNHVEHYRWLDARTIQQSDDQIFGQTHPGSVDWEFMYSHYRAGFGP